MEIKSVYGNHQTQLRAAACSGLLTLLLNATCHYGTKPHARTRTHTRSTVRRAASPRTLRPIDDPP